MMCGEVSFPPIVAASYAHAQGGRSLRGSPFVRRNPTGPRRACTDRGPINRALGTVHQMGSLAGAAHLLNNNAGALKYSSA